MRDVSWHPHSQEIISSSWDFTVRRWTGVEKVEEQEEIEARLDQKLGSASRDGDKRKEKKRKIETN